MFGKKSIFTCSMITILTLSLSAPVAAYANDTETYAGSTEDVIMDTEEEYESYDIAQTQESSSQADEDVLEGLESVIKVGCDDLYGNGSSMDVYLKGYSADTDEKIYALTWSDENGQDDLKWYEMSKANDGTFHAYINPSDHKTYGKYYSHIYSMKNNSLQFVSAIEFTVDAPAEPSCESLVVQRSGNSDNYDLKVSEIYYANGISRVRAAIWSAKDQSDLKWIDLSNEEDDDYSVQLGLSNYSLVDGKTYNVHVYMWDKDNNASFLDACEFEYEKYVNDINVDVDSENYSVNLKATGVTSGICALWTQENGQDDIEWHTMSYDEDTKNLAADFKKSQLKHTGTVYCHVYTYGENGLEYVNGIEFDTTEIEESFVATTDKETGDFTLKLNKSMVGSDTVSIMIPVWSQEGQADIVWYEAKKNSSGNYEVSSNISKHKGNCAIYNAHVYAKDANGNMTFITATTMDFKVSVDSITCEKEDNSHYDINVKNPCIPGGISEIKVAAWSDENGQDDVVWYKASKKSGVYTAQIDINNHKSYGKYSVHVYVVTKSGTNVYLGSYSGLSVANDVSGSLEIGNVDKTSGKFDVYLTLSDSTISASKLTIPVWTASDQSDIKWYTPEKTLDGRYKITVDIKNHKSNLGMYHIHVYGALTKSSKQYITGTEYYFDGDTPITASVSNGNSSYTKRLTYKSTGLDSVKFAVWSKENGQDDVVWYEGVKTSDGFYVDVDLSNHNGNGTYYAHMYTSDNQFIQSTEFSMIDYVEWAVETAADESVGYSQVYRDLNPDVDCSSFVYYSLYYNGFRNMLGSVAFYTGTESYYLTKCGFTKMEYTSEDDLRPGDILLYRRNGAGHTEIYIGDGLMVGAHDSVVNGIDYVQGGDQTGQEVSVKKFSNPGWMYVFRYYE